MNARVDPLRAVEPAVRRLAAALSTRAWRLTTAESCTGGLMAAACTAVAGSSDWFERGFVTYSNAAKTESLGVPETLVAHHGAVSEAVARAMAEGALRYSQGQLALAVTGIAGPGGGTSEKPVGTVWLAWSLRSPEAIKATGAVLLRLNGDRAAVRLQAVEQALIRGCAAVAAA